MIGPTFLLLAQSESPDATPAPPPPVLPDAPQQGTGPGDATTTTPGGTDADSQALPPGGGLDPLTIIMLLGVVLLFVFMFGGQRKEKKRRQAMLAAMKKGDRVQTVGGILGTITEMKDDEVTLKVDENSNTRMRFSRNAVQSVLEDKSE